MGIVDSSTMASADDQKTSPIVYIKDLPSSKLIAINSNGETLIADKLAKTWRNFGSDNTDKSQNEIQSLYQPTGLDYTKSPVLKILQTNGYTSTFNIDQEAYVYDQANANEAYWYKKNGGTPALSVSSPFYKGSSDIADYVNFYGTLDGQLYVRYLMKPKNSNSYFYGLDPITVGNFGSPIIKMIFDNNNEDQKPQFAKDGNFDFPKSLYMLLKSGAIVKLNIPQKIDSNGLNYFSEYDQSNPGGKAKALTRKTVADGISTLEPQDLAVLGSNKSPIQGVVEVAKGQVRFYDDKSGSNTIVNLPVKADETDYSNIITENDGTNDVARYILQDITQSNDIYLYDVSSCSTYSFGSISSCLSKPLDHKGFNDNYSTALDSVITNISGDKYIVVGFESGAVRYYNTTSSNWNTIQDDIYSSPVVNITKIDNNSIYISLENGLVEQYNFDTNNIDIIRQAASTLVFNSSTPT
ncbi:hypothetical protein AB9G26_08945, partial [Francisella philomiragia]|uniref:hypothetical protein n=1 Tax=Francisella philomiragia TaxID=28110 RepID=UPI0035185BF1